MRPIDADALKEDLTRFYDGEVTARNLIDEQPTIGGWISVEERLPEEDKDVLAYNGAYMIIAAYATNPTKYWYTITGSATLAITHWMPMPEPPTGDKS